MKVPKVTVVTVCFNAINDLENTILSVLSQKYENLEYIIVDGKSTDGTLQIISKYKSKIDYLISEKDDGIYHAMNKSIKIATGVWILFLNAGDRFYNNNVLEQIFNKKIESEKLVIYGNTCLSIENEFFFAPALPINEIEKHLPFCHQSALIKTIYLKNHPFNLEFKVTSDYNSFYDIYKLNSQAFFYQPIIISIYNSNFGFSQNNILTCIREEAIISQYYSTLLLKFRLSYFYIRALLNKFIPFTILKYKRKRYIQKNYQQILKL